jgi:putative ABC transport system permease protein
VALRGSPATRALGAAAALALVLAALLSALTVALTLLLAGPARARLLAVLRSLGGGPRQGRALVAWETAPWIAVSVVAVAVLAWALPAVVLASVDLTPLTEGSAQPPARYDPAVLAGLGGGLVLVALVAAALVAVLSGRDVAARLRAGEDR